MSPRIFLSHHRLLLLFSGTVALSAGAFAQNKVDVPTVAVCPIVRGEGCREVSFDAELRPFQEVELHAKVTGYLDTLTVDAGDVVKEGQLLATLDVPEVKSELNHAEAERRRAAAEVERGSAAYDDAHLTLTRLMATDKAQPHMIAVQEIDTAKVHDRAATAALDGLKEQLNVAASEVERLQAMVGFARITAPFGGVITKRHVDPGALIQAGTSAGAMPVVRLSQNDKLRVVFPVSISFVSDIRVGDPVDIHIAALNKTISGKVARFSRKVETSTRTMDVEVDLPNPDLSLIPGIYAVATLKTDRRENALFVPIEAVSHEKGSSSLYVVNAKHLIEERPIKVGLETPTQVEILSGAQENELVMIGSRASVSPGETVTPNVVKPTRLE